MARVPLTDRAVQAAKAGPGQRLELWDGLTLGLCLRVTDKGVKSWVLRYRTLDGRQPRLKLGDAKRMGVRAARLEAGRLKDLIDKGGDPQFSAFTSSNIVMPTKKGVSLQAGLLPELIEALTLARDKAEEMGWIGGGGGE